MAQHFRVVEISQSTVYNVLKTCKERRGTERAEGSGHPAKLMDCWRIQKLIKDATSQKYSQWQLAEKYDISLTYVNKHLQGNDIHPYKKDKIGHATASQQETRKVRVSQLYQQLLDTGSLAIITDDESYFTLAHTSPPGNAYYYASN